MFTTLNEKAEISLIRDGELEISYRIQINWSLPEGRSADERTRSKHFKPFKIINTVTLRKGQKWVEILTELDNTVEDHYLQVSFPTGIIAENIMAQGQFDVIARPVAKPDYSLYDEIPMTEHPMNSFVDLSNGSEGIAFLNEGLKAYEASDDMEGTLSLTLLRCYPLRICVTREMLDYSQLDKGSQCLGKHIFRYSIMPHTGDWEKGMVWQASEQFNLKLSAAQLGPTKYGKNPLIKSFLEFEKEGLHVSAVKKSDDGQGFIIRLFNPYEETVKNSIRFNGGLTGPASEQSPVERIKSEFELPRDKGKVWSKVRLVTLEELPLTDLNINSEGWVAFEITKKKILTLEFLP